MWIILISVQQLRIFTHFECIYVKAQAKVLFFDGTGQVHQDSPTGCYVLDQLNSFLLGAQETRYSPCV